MRAALDARRAWLGLRDALPLVPSTLLPGLIFGAAAQAAGLGQTITILMSALVFSGSGQFAALPLWQESLPVIFLSVLVLALRFALMTASMAPRLAGAPAWLRAALAYGVTDENDALAVSRRGGEMEPEYLAGSWVALYLAWVAGTAGGALFGARAPAALASPLQAVFPMVFIILTVLTCRSGAAALVALLGAALGVLGALTLAGGWHVVAAGLLASLAGPALERVLARGKGRGDAA